MGPSSRRLSSQILRMQVLILAGTLVVGVLLALYAARDRLDPKQPKQPNRGNQAALGLQADALGT